MLKIGILGVGFMGGTHAAAFAGLPDVQIVGISSRSGEKAAALAAKYGAEPFADAFALATDPRVDIISNTLPTQLHKDLTVAALNAGKHVLVEKPMGLSVAECDEMIAAAKQSDRLLMVAHVLRFWPEYVAIADFLKTGALGKPLAATAKRLVGPPRWSDFFLHPEWSGGGVLDLQVHDLDTLNWLFGTPKTVYARGQRSPESGGWDLAHDAGGLRRCAGFRRGQRTPGPRVSVHDGAGGVVRARFGRVHLPRRRGAGGFARCGRHQPAGV